jgi:hypothetical protein
MYTPLVTLIPECEEYLARYDEYLARAGVPEAERAQALGMVRTSFEQACAHEHVRAAMADAMRQAIAQLEGVPNPPSEPPAPEREVRGDLDALAPADRAFVSFWHEVREERFPFRDLHRFTRPGGLVNEMQLGRYHVRLIEGYEETLNPRSTGALTIRFWRTHGGLYFAQEAGGCVAYRNVLYGPFAASGDRFEQVER